MGVIIDTAQNLFMGAIDFIAGWLNHEVTMIAVERHALLDLWEGGDYEASHPGLSFTTRFELDRDMRRGIALTDAVSRFVLGRYESLPGRDQARVDETMRDMGKLAVNPGRPDDEVGRLIEALNHGGYLPGGRTTRSVKYLPIAEWFGERPEFYDLGREEIGRGVVGFVNGWNTDLTKAVGRTEELSRRLLGGCNLHCVHNPDLGAVGNLLRTVTGEAGHRGRTSLFLVNQWINFLDGHPGDRYLQLCHSDGTTHVLNALKLLKQIRPDLCSRMEVISLCSAVFIPTEGEEWKVKHYVKMEDRVVQWAPNRGWIGEDPSIIVLPDEEEHHPHEPFSPAFMNALRLDIARYRTYNTVF